MGILDSLKSLSQEILDAIVPDTYEERLAKWQEEDSDLRSLIQQVPTFQGLTKSDIPQVPLLLKKNERVFFVGDGCVLVEPRRQPGQYLSLHQGFSFRIAKGVRYYTGASRGTYLPGPETPTKIDFGVVTFTNHRITFQGPKRNREWSFSKMLGYIHDEKCPLTTIHVSNRQKASGFLYDLEHQYEVRVRFALALAHYTESIPQLVEQLESELAAHQFERPVPPT